MRWVLVALLLIPVVSAATIYGSVYDFSLNTVKTAVVEINSTPGQVMVAKNGTYSFSVPPGRYLLSAKDAKTDAEIEENISVAEGQYVLDLILLPALEQDESLLEGPEEVPEVEAVIEDKPVTSWLLWIVVFALLAYIVYRVSKKPAKEIVVEKEVIKEVVKEVKEVPIVEELNQIMQFIEKEGGRTTQKDIRKQFPYSEAKISLMIDELESKGLVKKVKKGRGNIILKS
jgi:uncharacterized membrane protein